MKFLKSCMHYFIWLWSVTKEQPRLTFPHNIIFKVLCCFEKIYKFFFAFNSVLRKMRGGYYMSGVTVISIGNLSLGGTGKSVVVSLLATILGKQNCAVVLRGYKRRLNYNKVLLVHDGKKIISDVSHAGDEACMLAKQLEIPVVVCKDRLYGCRYLIENFPYISYIILDDAYQNFRVKKDKEILLLDARAPFENGHCLPAGRLREKDYMRANIILLMHSDGLSAKDIQFIKHDLLNEFNQKNILCTYHALTKIFSGDGIIYPPNILHGKRVILVAGLGDPSSFIKKIGELGAEICDAFLFPDHYDYQQQDLEKIIRQSCATCSCGIVTTEKDWVKLKSFKEKYYGTWYIPRVSIEFLSQEEYIFFESFLKKS